MKRKLLDLLASLAGLAMLDFSIVILLGMFLSVGYGITHP